MFSLSLFVCAPLFFLSLSLFHCNHNTSHAYPLFTPTSKIATTVTDIPFSQYFIRVSFGFIQSVFWTEKELILYNWAFCFLPNRIKWTSKHQVHTYTSYSLNEAIRNIKNDNGSAIISEIIIFFSSSLLTLKKNWYETPSTGFHVALKRNDDFFSSCHLIQWNLFHSQAIHCLYSFLLLLSHLNRFIEWMQSIEFKTLQTCSVIFLFRYFIWPKYMCTYMLALFFCLNCFYYAKNERKRKWKVNRANFMFWIIGVTKWKMIYWWKRVVVFNYKRHQTYLPISNETK